MGIFNNEIKKKEKIVAKPPTYYLNYRKATTQSGLSQWFIKSGYGFSREIDKEAEGTGAIRVHFDCHLVLAVSAIKQKPGEASLKLVAGGKEVSHDEDTRKRGNFIILTHTGWYRKNDLILVNFKNAADIRLTIYGN